MKKIIIAAILLAGGSLATTLDEVPYDTTMWSALDPFGFSTLRTAASSNWVNSVVSAHGTNTTVHTNKVDWTAFAATNAVMWSEIVDLAVRKTAWNEAYDFIATGTAWAANNSNRINTANSHIATASNSVVALDAKLVTTSNVLATAMGSAGISAPTATNISEAVLAPFTNSIATAWQNPSNAVDFEWTNDGTNVTITAFNGTYTDVIVPDMLDGYPVHKIGDSVFYDKGLTSIEIGDHVKELGTSVFNYDTIPCLIQAIDFKNVEILGGGSVANLPNLLTVELKKIKSIGASAFFGCTALVSARLYCVESIGDSAFNGCTSLVSVYFSGNKPTEGNTVYEAITANQVTNLITSSTAQNWGATFGGMPVVRMPMAGTVITIGAVEASGNVEAASYTLNGVALTTEIPVSRGAILGDSTIADYAGGTNVASLLLAPSDVLAGTAITNLAVPGHTILQQHTVWTNNPQRATYDFVVMQIGLNDMAYYSSSVIVSNLQNLVNAVVAQGKPGVKVIVSTMIPARQRYIDLYGESVGAVVYASWPTVNEAIMGGGAKPITNVAYRVGNHTLALDDGLGNLALAYDTGDHIHENNAARTIIASAYRAVLQQAGFLRNTSPSWFRDLASPDIRTPVGQVATGAVVTVNVAPTRKIYSVTLNAPATITNNLSALPLITNGFNNAEWELACNITHTNAFAIVWDTRCVWSQDQPEMTVTGLHKFAFSTIDGVRIMARQTWPITDKWQVFPATGIAASITTATNSSLAIIPQVFDTWMLCEVRIKGVAGALNKRYEVYSHAYSNGTTTNKILASFVPTAMGDRVRFMDRITSSDFAYNAYYQTFHWSIRKTGIDNTDASLVVARSRRATESEIAAYLAGWRP